MVHILAYAGGSDCLFPRQRMLPKRALPKLRVLQADAPEATLLSLVSTGSAMTSRAMLARGGALAVPGLSSMVQSIEAMGPGAPLALSMVYVCFEMLSIPASALAALAGALFGIVPGFLLVLSCGVTSAALSFLIGRKFRGSFISMLENRPRTLEKFIWIDHMVTKGGFKALLLLRLVPTPFPALNYLYGVTSVKFVPYVLATLLGYTPGTFALIYSGVAGKEILSGGVRQPWYVYAAVALVITAIGKIATNVISQLSDEFDRESKVGEG